MPTNDEIVRTFIGADLCLVATILCFLYAPEMLTWLFLVITALWVGALTVMVALRLMTK